MSTSTPQKQQVTAYLGLLLAVVSIACTPILMRMSEGSMSPTIAIFNRSWIAMVILIVWNLGRYLKHHWHRSTVFRPTLGSRPPWLLVVVIATSLPCHLFWAWSLTKTSVASSEVLHSFTPVFTTLIGWLFLRQSFDKLFLQGIIITVAGSILLVGSDYSTTPEKLQGDALALMSALFWALTLMSIQKLQSRMGAVEIFGWISAGIAIFMSILFYVSGTSDPIFPYSLNDWLIEGALGCLSVVTNVLIISSLKVFPASLVATVLLLNPMLTAILGYLIFSEPLGILGCLAMFMVIAGIYLTSLGKMQQKRSTPS